LRFVVLGVALLSVVPAWGVEAPMAPIVRSLPEDALFFLEAQDLPGLGDRVASAWIWKDKAAAMAFLREQVFNSMVKDLSAHFAITPAQLQAEIRNLRTLYVVGTGMRKGRWEPEVEFSVILEMAQPGALGRIWDLIPEKTKADGKWKREDDGCLVMKPDAAWLEAGRYVLFSSSAAPIRKIRDAINRPPARSLAQSEPFRQCHALRQGATLWGYANPPEWIRRGEATMDDDEREEFQKVVSATSLRAFPALAIYGFAPGVPLFRTEIFAAKDNFLYRVLRQRPRQLDSLRLAPDNVFFYAATTLDDAGKTWEGVLRFIDKVQTAVEEDDVTRGIKQFEAKVDVNIRRDFCPLLGDEVCVFLPWPGEPGLKMFGNITFGAKVKDRAALSRLIEKVAAHPDIGVEQWKRRAYHGGEIVESGRGFARFSYGFVGPWALGSLNPKCLEEAIDAYENRGKALATVPAFTEAHAMPTFASHAYYMRLPDEMLKHFGEEAPLRRDLAFASSWEDRPDRMTLYSALPLPGPMMLWGGFAAGARRVHVAAVEIEAEVDAPAEGEVAGEEAVPPEREMVAPR